MKLAVLAFIIGTQALPQWLNNLRSDSTYAPAAYNPIYGPPDGTEGYSYGGYGPQPTAITIYSSTSSRSETSGTCTRCQTYAYNCLLAVASQKSRLLPLKSPSQVTPALGQPLRHLLLAPRQMIQFMTVVALRTRPAQAVNSPPWLERLHWRLLRSTALHQLLLRPFYATMTIACVNS